MSDNEIEIERAAKRAKHADMLDGREFVKRAAARVREMDANWKRDVRDATKKLYKKYEDILLDAIIEKYEQISPADTNLMLSFAFVSDGCEVPLGARRMPLDGVHHAHAMNVFRNVCLKHGFGPFPQPLPEQSRDYSHRLIRVFPDIHRYNMNISKEDRETLQML